MSLMRSRAPARSRFSARASLGLRRAATFARRPCPPIASAQAIIDSPVAQTNKDRVHSGASI
jgi:hypothetical protein